LGSTSDVTMRISRGQMKRLIIRLANDITASTDDCIRFVQELSLLAGVPLDQFHLPHLRSGCTLFDCVLEKAAVERLVEYFEKLRTGLAPESLEAKAFGSFTEGWHVEVLTDDNCTKGVRVTVRPVTNSGSVIVLVHGWGGDSESTFGNLPNYLSKCLGVGVLVYEYPSNWFKQSPSIVFVARNLDNWIRNRTADGCRIGFIAHSLGGIATRYLAVLQEDRERPLDIRQITLVSSPTEGAALATIANHVPLLNKTQIIELGSNSSFLVDLNGRWVLASEVCASALSPRHDLRIG
jgi:pimeloyl-ACP methyl ester carboxylesterase